MIASSKQSWLMFQSSLATVDTICSVVSCGLQEDTLAAALLYHYDTAQELRSTSS